MKNRYLRLPWMLTVVWAFTAVALSGCESVIEVIQRPLGSVLSSDRQPPQLPAQSSSNAEIEAVIHQRINQIRQENGLPPLRENEDLVKVARSYSQQMAEKNFFSHTGPNGDNVAQRVTAAGVFYIMVGENLAKTVNAPQPAQFAVEGWMESPGHRENILRTGFSEGGIGVWQIDETYYFTHIFLRSL